MAKKASNRPDQPIDPVQRRRTDALWFGVLFASVATGIGMTIFAPVGDAPPAAVTPAPSATMPAFEPATAPAPATTAPAPAGVTLVPGKAPRPIA